jgi:cell division control protein 24
VLDELVAQGKITGVAASLENAGGVVTKRTQREHIIDELVKTERTYVQHLELLQEFKKLVEEKGVISGDQVHDIFLNLNALLDFQRRFLIRVEQTNAQHPDEQNWGNLFVLYKDAFKVYEPYIANQKKCEQIAMREFDKLKETGGPAEMRQMVESPTLLASFLLKPFQRLTKYPLLLRVCPQNLLPHSVANTHRNSKRMATSTKDDEKTLHAVSKQLPPCSQAPTTPLRAKNVSRRWRSSKRLWKTGRVIG